MNSALRSLWGSPLLFATVHEPTPNLRLRQRQPTSTLVLSGYFTVGEYGVKMTGIGSLNLQCIELLCRSSPMIDEFLTKNSRIAALIHRVTTTGLF
jgi:hypothetical protein